MLNSGNRNQPSEPLRLCLWPRAVTESVVSQSQNTARARAEAEESASVTEREVKIEECERESEFTASLFKLYPFLLPGAHKILTLYVVMLKL